MSSTLLSTWLSERVSPQRTELLMDTVAALEKTIGTGVDTFSAEAMSYAERVDTTSAMDYIVTGLFDLSISAFVQFQIVLSERIAIQDQKVLTAILGSLESLIDYEIPNDIIVITSKDISLTEKFSELVSMITGVASDDILLCLESVHPNVIQVIESNALDKLLEYSETDTVIIEVTQTEMIKVIIERIEESNAIVEYQQYGGTLGYELKHYFIYFYHTLMQYEDPETIAKYVVLICLYANVTLDSVEETVKLWISKLWPDPQSAAAIFTHTRRLIGELTK